MSFADVGAVVASTANTDYLMSMPCKDKAFHIPCQIHDAKEGVFNSPVGCNQADQGSDLNLVSSTLLNWLGITPHDIANVQFKGLAMKTATGAKVILTHFAILHISVEGIWRDAYFFVVLNTSFPTEVSDLLLGLPWLYMVDATIAIWESTIYVGDSSLGETPQAVQGPRMVPCREHYLILYPKRGLHKVADVEDADDEDTSSDTDGEY